MDSKTFAGLQKQFKGMTAKDIRAMLRGLQGSDGKAVLIGRSADPCTEVRAEIIGMLRTDNAQYLAQVKAEVSRLMTAHSVKLEPKKAKKHNRKVRFTADQLTAAGISIPATLLNGTK